MNAPDQLFKVSHLNLRQSIVIYILRVFFLEGFFLLIHFLLSPVFFYFDQGVNSGTQFFTMQNNGFLFLGFLKMIFISHVTLQWLNNVIVIYKDRIVHRRGVFFKDTKIIKFVDVREVRFKQTLFGKMLNYGSIMLLDRYSKKWDVLPYVHDALRHFKLITSLHRFDEEKEEIDLHMLDIEDTKI